MLIEISTFKGEVPIVDPKQLPSEHAQVAINADLSQNILKPFYEIGDAKILNTTAWRSIFLIRYSGAVFWLCSTEEINGVNIPIQESKGRICYTDGTKPKESNFTLASNDGANTYGIPNTAYYLGVPKPTSFFNAVAKESSRSELMPNQEDRDFSAASAWVNVDLDAYDETDDLTITASAVDQYCTCPVTSAPTTIGKSYKMTFDIANLVSTWIIKSFDGIQTIGTVSTDETGKTLEWTATTTGGYRIVAVASDSSADFDNFTLKETIGDVSGSISYIYTFVTGWGYEGEPSDPTAVIDISEGQYVELRNFEIPVPSNYNIVGIRIYRTATGIDGTDFQLVTKIMEDCESTDYITPAEISTNGGIWNDIDTEDDEISDDADLGEVISCTDYIQPPDDLKGIITLPNGVTVGYRGKEVYLSEPYIHYGYPFNYIVTTDFDIKSIGWYGTTIVVGTEGYPYKVNGYDPQNVSIEKQPDQQACLFSRAMVNGPRFVLYPSPDGLYMISDEGNRNVTENIFTKEQWRDVLTNLISYDKTIIAFLYDDKYYAFFEGTNEGFVINFRSEFQFYTKFTLESGLSVYGGYVDLIDDTLYLLIKSGSTYYVKEWEGFNNLEISKNLITEAGDNRITEAGDNRITTGTSGITEDFLMYQWKSKIFVTSYAFFSCMKIDGDFVEDITGTGQIISSDTTIIGTGTSFTTELKTKYVLFSSATKEYREIASIETDTSLTLVSAFSDKAHELEYYADKNDFHYVDENGQKYGIEIPILFKYNTTMLNIYKDDTLFFTRAINSTNPFRLPPGTGKNWEIEIKGIGKVVNVKVGQSMAELN